MSETNDPYTKAIAVTKSDTTILLLNDQPPRAIYVGGAGNVAVQFGDLTTSIVIVGVPAGTTLRIRPSRVMSTSTTAASILALY